MVNYDRILKDCFWDSNITAEKLQQIVLSDDTREKQKLFSKIIYNSSDKLQALQLFSHQQLKDFFEQFQATYNKKYINKHILILRSLLLDETHYIKGLQWQKV